MGRKESDTTEQLNSNNKMLPISSQTASSFISICIRKALSPPPSLPSFLLFSLFPIYTHFKFPSPRYHFNDCFQCVLAKWPVICVRAFFTYADCAASDTLFAPSSPAPRTPLSAFPIQSCFPGLHNTRWCLLSLNLHSPTTTSSLCAGRTLVDDPRKEGRRQGEKRKQY